MNRFAFWAIITSAGLLLACGSNDDSNSAAGSVVPPQAASETAEQANSTTGYEANPSKQSGPAGSDDPITALCVDYHEPQSVCECASARFRAENENADLYAAIAAYYLSKTDKQKSIADRWQEAVDATFADYSAESTGLGSGTEKLKLNNALGRAHREAIKACSG